MPRESTIEDVHLTYHDIKKGLHIREECSPEEKSYEKDLICLFL